MAPKGDIGFEGVNGLGTAELKITK